MTPQVTQTGRRMMVLTLTILVGAIAAGIYLLRTGEPPPPPPAPPPAPPVVARPGSEAAAPGTDPVPAPARGTDAVVPAGVLPLDNVSLEQFQEANSRITTQLSTEHQNVPYAVAASMAARRAIAELGHDPNQTLVYWLSPAFNDDLAAGDPALAVDRRRLVDSLLAVLLGDQAGTNEFEQILSGLSPEARQRAVQRRAHR